jgi:hypothetical protein
VSELTAEAVQVLRPLGPDDRLAVLAETSPTNAEAVLDAVAEWAGIDRHRVVLIVGGSLQVVSGSE